MKSFWQALISKWETLPFWSRTILLFFIMALTFSLAHGQDPLYTSNQLLYFLHGFAQAHVGQLNHDWLSNIADTFPLFSWLVKITLLYLRPYGFYIYQGVLYGIYIYSLVWIGLIIGKFHQKRLAGFLIFTVLLVLHAKLVSLGISRLLGVSSDFQNYLEAGVAEHNIVGMIFQPSSLGILFLLSLLLWLKERRIWACLVALIAAMNHANYLLPAGLLIVSYAWVDWRQTRKLKDNLVLYGFFCTALLGIFYFTTRHFWPTTTAISNQAMSYLVTFRFPHHANPLNRLSLFTDLKILFMLLGLYLLRRHKLFWPLVVLFIVAALGTTAELVTNNPQIPILNIWRTVTILEPIVVVVVLAKILERLMEIKIFWQDWFHKVIVACGLTAIVLLAWGGLIWMRRGIVEDQRNLQTLTADYTKANLKTGQMYLIPTEMEKFRLYSSAPTFVDFKSHPYKDTDVLEWYKRIKLAEAFQSADGQNKCPLLTELVKIYGITDVITESGKPLNCHGSNEVFENPGYRIYHLDTLLFE